MVCVYPLPCRLSGGYLRWAASLPLTEILLSPKFHQAHTDLYYFFIEAYSENRSFQETPIFSSPATLFLDTKLSDYSKSSQELLLQYVISFDVVRAFFFINVFDNIIYKVIVNINVQSVVWISVLSKHSFFSRLASASQVLASKIQGECLESNTPGFFVGSARANMVSAPTQGSELLCPPIPCPVCFGAVAVPYFVHLHLSEWHCETARALTVILLTAGIWSFGGSQDK